MKVVNAILGIGLIIIPALLFWADCWFNGVSPQQKYDDVMSMVELDNVINDMSTHTDLMEAYQNKKISHSEYIHELEKLQRKVKREASKTQRNIEREIK